MDVEANVEAICSGLNMHNANGFNISSTFDSTKLHERPGIQSQALGFSRASSYNVERGGQTASTSFNIHDKKKNVEQMLKQSINTFKLVQH